METRNILGVDIGGTKCAVTYGRSAGPSEIEVLDKESFATTDCAATIENIKAALHRVIERNSLTCSDIYSIGISCGGPLDSASGVVMSPPNLPGWDNVPIVKILSDEFGVKAAIHNDANACALAEWTFGAGKGTRNMAFLTFGTGLGAGLILDGRLYTGTNDNAGELGHIRLADFGPVGYGKAGSFEGFCSGSGIRQLAQSAVRERLQMGVPVDWCPDGDIEGITAKKVAEAMLAGDALALEIYATSARYLGVGLSVLIDIINPEVIVIGSIYARNEEFFKPLMQQVLDRESLPLANKVCRVVPAALGESIGDYAALSVGANI